ncbi:DUF3822 family protein [Hymenobacter sp. ASUV-10]|uniref:DUF3822 family protein n=1 Tax=Hymenobacter aranciens TaxID=3063996 RepID=A0ABT9BD71_9BACT|nr:DUF3822 family protein [Hymenobacter sp. ASUV-10]MDO7876200.1 DUF3822 family protein [Hymenobacter sp. ASUV-10]
MPAPAAASSVLIPASPLLRIRDDAFDTGNLDAYNLYLTTGSNRLRLAVVDSERRKFVALEEYELPTAALPAMAEQHDFLGRRGWNEVRLAVTGRAFTLLPAPLFRPGDEEAALRLHHVLPATETARHFVHPNLELVNIYAADTSLTDWLSDTYGNSGRVLHHTSALLAGVAHQRPAGSPRRLYLNLGHGELTLIVLGQYLEYCNVFAFTTAEDVLYYTILVMQELGLNPDQDEVAVWGELLHDSAIFSLLRTYLRQVRLGPRPPAVQYSYRLDDVFEHRYFDLLSLHFV